MSDAIPRTNENNQSWLDTPDMQWEGADQLYEELMDMKPEERGQIRGWSGKMIDVPRWQKTYGKDYYFTGSNHVASEDIPECLAEFVDWANEHYDCEFNQVLINWYMNGHEYIGSHSDDERQLVKGAPIVSLSLGEERKFRLRDKSTKDIVEDIMLPHGSIVAMCGKFQSDYKHEIVKVSGKKGEAMGPRINVTLRVFEE